MTEFQVKGGQYTIRNDRDGLQVVRVVTEQKGSWKWQDAYRISFYAIRYSPRKKRHYFESVAHSGKFAMTKANQERYAGVQHGGLHNLPVPADVLAAWQTLTEVFCI